MGRPTGRRTSRQRGALAPVLVAALIAAPALARSPADPIQLVWDEGDLAGVSTIQSPEGEPVGFVEYHQQRRGDVLSCARIAHFRDGSSDEDTAEARLTHGLEALSGRSVVRDVDGEPIVDVQIDVGMGRIEGTWGRGTDRRTMSKQVVLPPATYWGPLVFLVLKNFDANAEADALVFRTVAPTPRPRVLDLELVKVGPERMSRVGGQLDAVHFELRPTIHWAIDPLIRLLIPRTVFYILPGSPPALARYVGPRNYGGQAIRIE